MRTMSKNWLLERLSFWEQRLTKVTEAAPMFSAALRGYRLAQGSGDQAMADGILAWLSGQPNVSANAKRFAE